MVSGATVVLPIAAEAAPPASPKPNPGPQVTKVHTVEANDAKQAAPPPEYRATATALPAMSSVTLTLDAKAKARANGSPVWVQPVADANGRYTGPATLGVRVADRAATEKAGVTGVLLAVDPQSAGSGAAQVGVDYGGFAQAYGGNYAERLHLVRLPGCALYTPEKAECRQATPLPTTRDRAAQTLSTPVTFTAPVHTANSSAASLTAATAPLMVLAATTDAGQDGGGLGTYAATDLKASGSWSSGGSTGGFGYSYAITLPPTPAGAAPELGLGYSSSGVDGQTSFAQAQASWAGDGWSLPQSYIEQTFLSCKDSPEGSAVANATPDLCYAGPILTMSLKGSSTSLVWDAGKSVWRPEHEDGSVITHVTNVNNGSGTYNNDWWTVTTRDGATYSFGRNHLPGWTSGKAATNSVDSEPVYAGHSTDPMWGSCAFPTTACTTAYRWNLDYAVDTHGNAVAYYYHQDTNFYGLHNGASNVSYVRSSYPDHIDYGFTDGNAYGTVPDKVLFGTDVRCTNQPCSPLNASTKANWPDVPYDAICASGATCAAHSPSFFSTVRLKTITARQWSTSANDYVTLDTYTLKHSLPAPSDNTSPTLFLTEISRTASDTSAGPSLATNPAITLPPTTFTPVALANRRDTTSYPALYRNRIGSITTETGSVISPTYTIVNPCSTPVTLDPATNTTSCYPVYWTPEGLANPMRDWFLKYSVTKVTQSDPLGGNPATATSYEYLGGSAWHYDTGELVKPQNRTYGQYRGFGDVKTRTGDLANDPRTLSETTYYRGMSNNNNTTAVTLTDSQGGTHDDADQLAGSALETTSYLGDGGPVDKSTISSFWVSPATATRNRTGLPALTANWIAPAETFTRQAVTGSGATTWRYTEADTSYDTNTASPTYGSVVWQYTHTVPAQAAYDSCTHTTYAPANTTKNLVALPAAVESDAVACGGFTSVAHPSAPWGYNTLTAPAAVNRPAQVISATRTFYDDPAFGTTFPQTTAPSTGNPTMTQKASDYTAGALTYLTNTKVVYDSVGRITKSFNANGYSVTTAYTTNTVGLVTGSTTTNDSTLTHTSTTLDPTRNLVRTGTDANGVVTAREYDTLGRAAAVWLASRPTTDPANYLYTYSLANTGPAGRVSVKTQRMNDSGGYVASTVIYDGLFRVRQTQSTTPNGGRLISDTFYDSRGWTRATNDGWSNPGSAPNTTLVAPDQISPAPAIPVQHVYTYDGLGRAVIDTSANSGVTVSTKTTVYNGDRTTVIPPVGGVATAVKIDPLGRAIETDQYSTPPALNTPANTFTGVFSVSGGTAVATQFGFDSHGNQSTVTDADGSVWTSAFDLLGRVTAKTDPDVGGSGFKYDNLGNLTETTDSRSKTTSFVYDALSRKTAAYNASLTGQAPANQIAAWVYDNSDNAIANMKFPLGHLTSSTAFWNGNGYKIQYRNFNKFGESLGETVTIPSGSTGEGSVLGRSYVYTHAYSSLTGLPSADVYPAGNGLPAETVNYGYTSTLDLLDTVGGLGAYEDGTAYDDWGRVSYTTLGGQPNVAHVTNQYDPHTGQLTNAKVTRPNSAPNDVDEEAYQYDLAGKLLRQTSTRLGAAAATETQCYGYDGLARLTAAWTAIDDCTATPTPSSHATVGDTLGASSAYWTTWTIDPLGNRTEQVQHAVSSGADKTTGYTYNGDSAGQPHTLTGTSTTGGATATTTYHYDSAGNMTYRNTPGQGAKTFTWNNQGQLVTALGASGTTTFKYGGDGGLLVQHEIGTTTLYLPGQQLVLNNTTQAVTGTRYYALPGGAVAVRTGTAASDFTLQIADQHGTPSLYLNSTVQTPTWRQSSPYGEPRGTVSTWPDNHGFLGAPTNGDTGLTRLGARDYDPSTGRFTSIDPVFASSDAQLLNGYSYARNAPTNTSDPSGLCPRDRCVGYGQAPGHPEWTPAGKPDDPGGDYQPSTSWASAKAPTKKLVGQKTDTMTDQEVRAWMKSALGCEFSGDGPVTNGDATACAMKRPDNYTIICTQMYGYAEQYCMHDPYAKGGLDIVFLTVGVFVCGPLIEACVMGVYDLVAYGGTGMGLLEAAGAGTVGVGGLSAEHLAGSAEAKAGESAAALGRLCANSFTPDTLVQMADGSTKAIGDVRIGDQVLTYDPDTGVAAPHVVTWRHRNLDTDLTDLTLTADGRTSQTVHTTQGHLFWSETRHAWIGAGRLRLGEQLRTADGSSETVVSRANRTAGAIMYNLTVESVHTYYVLAGNTPVLVHNCILFENQMPRALPAELAAADRLGVTVSRPGTASFDAAVSGGTVKWAVLEDGSLVVMPKFVGGHEISHAVLSRGEPVIAAGEADIAGSSSSGYFGLDINNHSGHFRPSSESLQIGRDAFAQAGIGF
ncbi:polymorphic toxin-type HINT domain-containing protein [Dactylosporangium sp. NPDC051541]|uniref:polymorphic toxin-type HINT domain-containing protein n=1 Tax=Dactylosporangium sp. NPDC051541 TaxID=3363977 RepID=UPI0037952E40